MLNKHNLLDLKSEFDARQPWEHHQEILPELYATVTANGTLLEEDSYAQPLTPSASNSGSNNKEQKPISAFISTKLILTKTVSLLKNTSWPTTQITWTCIQKLRISSASKTLFQRTLKPFKYQLLQPDHKFLLWPLPMKMTEKSLKRLLTREKLSLILPSSHRRKYEFNLLTMKNLKKLWRKMLLYLSHMVLRTQWKLSKNWERRKPHLFQLSDHQLMTILRWIPLAKVKMSSNDHWRQNIIFIPQNDDLIKKTIF